MDIFLEDAMRLLGEEGTLVMLDTATAYGNCEERLGQWLKRHPEHRANICLATKWGGSFERECAGQPGFILSLDQLKQDIRSSVEHLGAPLDILYYHIPSSVPQDAALAALRDGSITSAMKGFQQDGTVRCLGASVSHADTLRAALEQKLFDGLDVVQVPAIVCHNHEDILTGLRDLDALVVLNSAVRKGSQDTTPAQHITAALQLDPSFVLLTGTRHHLSNTIEAAQKVSETHS